jgi:hypothetical protein
VHIQLGAAVDVGIGSDDGVAHGGAALRMALGGGPFALVVGAAALAPAETSIGGVRLRQWRLPFDVGGRVHLPGEHVQPYGELGLSAALLSERALELAVSRGGMSLALGIRAAAGLHLASSSRFAPFAALHAELVPSPPAVAALPQGIAGHTPFFWLGAVAGVSLGLL